MQASLLELVRNPGRASLTSVSDTYEPAIWNPLATRSDWRRRSRQRSSARTMNPMSALWPSRDTVTT